MTLEGTGPTSAAPDGEATNPEEIVDPGHLDEYMAQQPLIEASDRIQSLVESDDLNGFVGGRISEDDTQLILYWHGQQPQVLTQLLSEIQASGVQVDVRQTPYSLDALLAESRRIASLRETGDVAITGAGPNDDYSGIRVSVAPGGLSSAPSLITSTYPLSFVEEAPFMFITINGAGCGRSCRRT